MRYLVGFLCVCALGVVPVMGCSESAQCRYDKDCDDQNACTDDECPPSTNRCENLARPDGTQCDFDGLDGICISGVCGENPCDDGNECTDDLPGGECSYIPRNGGSCDWNGESGVCIDGVCEEDLCFGLVCDDGDTCTYDRCDYTDGMCHFSARSYDGEGCSSSNLPSGICIDGVCEQDRCPEMVCDDGDLCTKDACYANECSFRPMSCSDGNVCTDDACDPETGECVHTIGPDGTGCCFDRTCPCPGFCLNPPCDCCCTTNGHCENGECVADVGAFEVQP